MKIHEYQAKELFKKYGVPVPEGGIAFSADEVVEVANKLGGYPVVVKAHSSHVLVFRIRLSIFNGTCDIGRCSQTEQYKQAKQIMSDSFHRYVLRGYGS